jgi:hypothetical protein
MSQALQHGAAECKNELYCSRLAQDKDQWRGVVNTEMNLHMYIKSSKFLDW